MEPCHAERRLHAALVSQRLVLKEQLIQPLDPGDLAPFDLPKCGIEHFKHVVSATGIGRFQGPGRRPAKARID